MRCSMPDCKKYVTRVISVVGHTMPVASICGCDAVVAYYTSDGPTYRCKDHIEPQWEFAKISFEEALISEIMTK